MWFWLMKGLNALADKNDILAITKKINGGTNGLTSRTKYWKRALKAFNITTQLMKRIRDLFYCLSISMLVFLMTQIVIGCTATPKVVTRQTYVKEKRSNLDSIFNARLLATLELYQRKQSDIQDHRSNGYTYFSMSGYKKLRFSSHNLSNLKYQQTYSTQVGNF